MIDNEDIFLIEIENILISISSARKFFKVDTIEFKSFEIQRNFK